MELKTSAMRVIGGAAVALAGAVFVPAARSEDPVTLPMEISISSVSRLPEDRLAGTLRLQIDPESITLLLPESGRARLWVTLVLEQPAGPAEVRHLEIESPSTPAVNVWIHEAPLRWKKSFRTLTVRLELEGALTPTRVVASLKLPRAPGETASSRDVPESTSEGAAGAPGSSDSTRLPQTLPVHGEIGGSPADSWRPSDELVVLIGPGGVLDRLAASSRNPLLRIVVTAERNADPSLTPAALRYNGPCGAAEESLRAVRSMIFCQEFGVPFSEVDAWRIRLPVLHPIGGTLRLRVEVEEVWTHSRGAFVLPVAKAR